MKTPAITMLAAGLLCAAGYVLAVDAGSRHFNAQAVFDLRQPMIFQDDFQSGTFGKWTFSEDDRYRLDKETPARLKIVEAPGLAPGRRAVRFCVPRAPNSFRAELSLPHEQGFQERWYGGRLLVPADWTTDPTRASDIVMQWHAIPGNGKPTNPNLSIAVAGKHWRIRQNFGEPPERKKGWQQELDDPVQPGQWVAWVIHAKWSPREDGLIEIWKDGKQVVQRKGLNVYTNLGVDYTPYLKTGIYHPEWHLDKPGKREAFDREQTTTTNKIIFATDMKIGGERATFADVAPKP